ncbi:MAG: sodium:proton antiporter [Oligoflexia bacterium]|nr:MAG: sodium:proton antiporter [Oligoflexia bacterium]
MSHLPPMIYDLAVILAAAAISTLIFSRLKQPVVLGYLIAGFVVSPHVSFWPNIIDKASVSLWAEIGVIFLLFGLGLEFSFKKLAKVGKSASIAAVFELITMSIMGFILGKALGWPNIDSIFLGAILAMSSTTIIIRAFQEAGLKGQGFVNLVFGILIVEDLIAILLIVLLSAISVPASFSGFNLLLLTLKLGFFLLLWFLVGIYILPSALRKVRDFLTSELMLVVSVSLCFLMVILSTKVGFSAALGAFVMGSILAETEEGERIEHLLAPVRDLFAAIFFVSVGMMIDPSVLKEHYLTIVLITIITVIGKLLGSGFGAILSGRSLRQSVQAGMSLAQIGEFSFILATLGMTLKVTSEFLYPVVVAVSAVTTFTTPYMIRYSDSIYLWIERRLPQGFIEKMRRYELAMNSSRKEGSLRLIFRIYGLSILLNCVVVIGIGLLIGQLLLPLILDAMGDTGWIRAISAIGTLILSSPFLVAIMIKAPKKLSKEESETLARLKSLQLGLFAIRLLVGFSLIAFVVYEFATTYFLPILVLILTPTLMLIFRGFFEQLYSAVENRFLQNLNAKELAEVQALALRPILAPWSATLTNFVMSSDSTIAGLTLDEARFRSHTGATVAMIDRGKRRILAPQRSERLLPGDQIFLIGTDEQLSSAQRLIENKSNEAGPSHDELFSLESAVVSEKSDFAYKTIRECGIAELGGLVVGVERGNNRILNPESTLSLEPKDLVWIFGHREKLKALKQKL